MSEPEIDRRCSVCGAAVRPRSLFCPQCGQEIDHRAKGTEATAVVASPKTVVDFTETQPLAALPDLPMTQPLTKALPEPASEANHQNPKNPSSVSRAREGN